MIEHLEHILKRVGEDGVGFGSDFDGAKIPVTATSGLWRTLKPVEGELTASFDGRSVTYGFGELDALMPAYAASIHKSQGRNTRLWLFL